MTEEKIEYNYYGKPRAKRKDGGYIYRPGRPKGITNRFMMFHTDSDIETWLFSKKNRTRYLNNLIRKDMEENSSTTNLKPDMEV